MAQTMETPHPLSRRRVLLASCLEWYAESPEAARRVRKVLTREGNKLSLRVVEYFLNTRLRGTDHPLFWMYQRHLRIYGKANFDVFCREPKKPYKLTDDVLVNSTPAQLEFMRWFVESGAMDELEETLDDVLKAKQIHSSKSKEARKKNKNKKKKSLIVFLFFVYFA